MKILLDECVPALLKQKLAPHNCITATEAGFSGLKNGKLLARASESEFEIFLTIDKSLPYQQTTSHLPIAILVVRARGNRMVDLEPLVPAILESLPTLKAGTVTILPTPAP